MRDRYPVSKQMRAPIVCLVCMSSFVDVAAQPLDVQEEATIAEQIVVVAHKDERSIREIAANVTALDRADLSDVLSTSLSDVFRYLPGVDHEAAGTRFGTEGINIRGIGGNRVSILVDNVPLSDQFDSGSFSNATRDFIDAGMVQRIEVLHGPASALYGSAAIGGVVAIRTPDPSDLLLGRTIGGEITATWQQADGSGHAQLMTAAGGDSVGVFAGLSFRGGSERDAATRIADRDTRSYERASALLKFVADDARGRTWRVNAIHQVSETQSDLNSVLGSGRYRSTTALEGDDTSRMDVVSATLEFGEEGGLVDSGVLRGFYQSSEVEQATLDERAVARRPVSIDRFFSYDQTIRGVELNIWKNISGDAISHRLGLGVEYRDRLTKEYRDGVSTNLQSGATTNVLLGEQFPLRDFPNSRTREIAVFVEDTLQFSDWTVIAAVRADRYSLSPEVDAVYRQDYPDYQVVSLRESDVSPKLGVIYNLTDAVDVYAQYSHGFRAPPFSDANISLDVPFFGYRAIPNPDLKSETSNGIDVGIRWHGLRSTARFSVFRTRYKNFIESKINLGVDPVSGFTLFQSQNLEATRIEGVEAALQARFGRRDAFGIDAAAYYARGRNQVTGQPINSVGPAQAILGISWFSADDARQIRLKTSIADAYDRRDDAGGDLFKPAGYVVFDAFLTQKLGSSMVLRAGIHNLTDRTYWSWSDIRGLAKGDPILNTLSQAGRNASVSLSLAW